MGYTFSSNLWKYIVWEEIKKRKLLVVNLLDMMKWSVPEAIEIGLKCIQYSQ